MTKPMIRHCKNCEWCQRKTFTDSIDCLVRYTVVLVSGQRIKAIFCKHYKQKEVQDE